jgi:curved DNA-binding protein CbpA
VLIYLKIMNSLFDRLGDMLKDYIEDDQDIFSKPSDEKEDIDGEQAEARNNDAEPEAAEPLRSENPDKSKIFTDTQKSNQDSKPYTVNNNKPDSYSASQEKRKTFTFNTQYQQRTSFTKKPDTDYTIYKAPKPVPPQIRKDFDFFGLPLNARLDDCKAVYKKLLKVYHPDKHSSDPKKLKTATEYSARVNTAYKRLVEWFTKDNK